MTTKIHPLGQAHLDAMKALSDAYDTYISRIKEQFGPYANAYTQPDKTLNQASVTSYRAFLKTQDEYVETLAAMRRANVTVHPI
ncbi:MAG: hypothetical protein M3P98_04220 [bacterium]|nr:hypothetical protein [bacterium]